MKNQYYNNVRMLYVPTVKTSADVQCPVIDLNGFYKCWLAQKVKESQSDRMIPKEEQFQVHASETGHRFKKIKDDATISGVSKVCFLDIDSKYEHVKDTPLEGVSEQIVANWSEISKDSPFIFMQKSISGGIHVIAYQQEEVTNKSDFKRFIARLTALFCQRVEDILGVDLTSNKKVVDGSMIRPEQGLYVSTTDLYVNTNFTPHFFSEKEEAQLREQYPSIFEWEKKEREIKEKKLKGEYKDMDITDDKRYMVSISKNVHIDHKHQPQRYYIATSFKTLISTHSITIEQARKMFSYIIRKAPIVKSSYQEMEREFEANLRRQDIKPMIHFKKLKEMGINIVEC